MPWVPYACAYGRRAGMSDHRGMNTSAALHRLIALPKAEVHVHLEGTFAPATLEQWAHEAGVPMPRPRERLLQFEGLEEG